MHSARVRMARVLDEQAEIRFEATIRFEPTS
jgi:hypothetical protein